MECGLRDTGVTFFPPDGEAPKHPPTNWICRRAASPVRPAKSWRVTSGPLPWVAGHAFPAEKVEWRVQRWKKLNDGQNCHQVSRHVTPAELLTLQTLI